MKRTIVTALLVSGLIVGCGSPAETPDNPAGDTQGTGSGGTGGGGTGGGGSGGAAYYCCLNGAYYGCPSTSAMNACVGFDIGTCLAGCGLDFECQDDCYAQLEASSPDPSGCTRNSGKDGDCSSGGGGSGGGGSGGGGGGSGGGSGGGGSGGGGGGSTDDTGKTCTDDGDCSNRTCLFGTDSSGNQTDYGYCTKRCESFADCPTFWDCEEVGNAIGTYCVQD